jgi:hypothetical protein
MRCVERIMRGGIVESAQSLDLAAPAVPSSPAGAAELGRLYWEEVRRATGGLIRLRAAESALELCVMGRGPALFRLGPAELHVDGSVVACSYEIRGGLLARDPGGRLRISQDDGVGAATVGLVGFSPRLLPRGATRRFPRLAYALQARAHVAVSRRYLHNLRGGETR